MMLLTRRLAILALAATVLTGCATSTANLSTATVGAYRETIDLAGRLSVNYQKDGRPESISGSFNWEQRPGTIDVTLMSPLGQTVAAINVTPGSATLTQAGQEPRTAADIDSLTQQTLGWPLPVSGLRDWLQGYAVDAQGQRFRASPASNSVTTKDGWRLRFIDWQAAGAGDAAAGAAAAAPVPRLIQAERAASGDIQDLAIRIVVNPAA
ncbi:MAG: lipoprotein insertase outer membrane protein LolB [Massilia sp.]|uniref:lipoprotein insertase outer membrane protein LolB n=1 Tax=Massilia sp. TaxID=1882437 RepID=UPI002FC73EED